MRKVTRAIRARKYRTAAAAVIIATAASVGFNALTADAATAFPADQSGEVHSCTTGGFANVTTANGGYIWNFVGPGRAGTAWQLGVVHSFTTGGNANVRTYDGGFHWDFDDTSGPLFCSAP